MFRLHQTLLRKKPRFLFFTLFMAVYGRLSAQAVYQPYSYQFYQKLNTTIYSKSTRIHSSLKPMFADDSLIASAYQALMNQGVDTGRHQWLFRKLFNEHLVDVKGKDYTFYIDFLPDLTLGREFNEQKSTYLNTRGYQVGGTLGKNFSFYTSGFEDQGVFPNYVNAYINKVGIVPGQAFDRSFGAKRTKDWSYSTAVLSYTPAKFINLTLGQDKTFIGDGYRSLFLSDYSANYPFFKATATVGNVRYMAMWAYMQDPSAPKLSYDIGNRRKWGIFHYLDWNVNNRLSLGFFDAIISADADDQGHKRGFDMSYLNPFIFLRPVEASLGSPDNAVIGFSGKYKLFEHLALYSQFVLDEFESKNFFSSNGSSRNKYGFQIGLRGSELLGIKRLNYLLESNNVKPYTYSEQNAIINYAQNKEPIADPLGANFREFIGILNYSIGRFDFSAQGNYAY